MRCGLIAVLLVTWFGVADAGKLEPLSVRVVGQVAPGTPWTDRATEARLADGPRLSVVIVARERRANGRRGRLVYVVDDEVAPLSIRGQTIARSARRPWSALGSAAVQWFTVEPDAWRREGHEAPNGVSARWHSNVSTEPATFGKWLGYDEVTYFETPLGPTSHRASARIIPARVRPSAPDEDLFDGHGTIRYQVSVSVGEGTGVILSSPGAESTDKFGIRPDVHRVSIRTDDTILGYLTAYFLVPEIFGSAGTGRNHQTDRFVGADCADVLTGAARSAGFARVRHTNVAGLTSYTNTVAADITLDETGAPGRTVSGIQVGDLVRIDYGGALTGHTPRSWDHVAAIYRDRSDPDGPNRGRPNGQLDRFDLIVHMGHPRLEVEPLSGQAPARIDILRWDERKMRRRGDKPDS